MVDLRAGMECLVMVMMTVGRSVSVTSPGINRWRQSQVEPRLEENHF